MENIEFNINFTDITMNEANGVFDEVAKIMKDESVFNPNWVIRSDLSISSNVGMGHMTIQCHSNKNIYIVDYSPSIGDLFYNPDIQAISVWAQDNGWNIPQPSFDIIKSNKDFWKHFYDTLIIDSDYFDKIYGKRPQLE